MREVILVENLTKVFVSDWKRQKVRAVDDLSFSVQEGEVCGFLGPNGAGKTTTIKLLFGLLSPTSGRASILGGDGNGADFRKHVGFLPENPYFYDYLTGEEFLNFYACLFELPQEVRRTRVPELLKTVGLEGAGRLRLRKFSKGMLQRIGMAQALINDPKLLVLDEPQSGLDPEGRKQIRDLILEMKARGKTVLFSSHILSDAEMICDRVLIVRQGKLVATGHLEELLKAGSRGVEVRAEGLPAEAVESLRGKAASVIETAGQVQFHFPGDGEGLEEILKAVTRAGGRIISLVPRHETLEEVFLRETREDPR
jgi:ABC-2 type transport system ATP-binding protein